MENRLVQLQHVNVKLLLRNPEEVDLEPLIPVFHDWIRDQVGEGLLLDIADYRHVDAGPGVVLIGHGAPWEERCNLAAHFRETLPGVPIVASLRRQDKNVTGADYNLPADNPPLWVSTVRQALAGIG